VVEVEDVSEDEMVAIEAALQLAARASKRRLSDAGGVTAQDTGDIRREGGQEAHTRKNAKLQPRQPVEDEGRSAAMQGLRAENALAALLQSVADTGEVKESDTQMLIAHGRSEDCHCAGHGFAPCKARCPAWAGFCYSGRILDSSSYELVCAAIFRRLRNSYPLQPRCGCRGKAFPGEHHYGDAWRREEWKKAQRAADDLFTDDQGASDSSRREVVQEDHSTAAGNKFCTSFHFHMCHVRKGTRRTAFETFHDNGELQRIIRRTLSRVGRISDAMVRDECFFKNGAWILNFQPLVAARLIRAYSIGAALRSLVLFDPCGGWGGRMLGAQLSSLVSEYICCEPSTETASGLREMASCLERWWEEERPISASGGEAMKVRVLQEGCETASASSIGQVDLVLTSPPYFNLEHYCDEATQSDVKFASYGGADGWLRGFLLRMYVCSFSCLRENGFCLINITNTPSSNGPSAHIEEDSLAVACEAGFAHIETIDMRKPEPGGVPGHAGLPKQPPARVNPEQTRRPEKIYVFQKPSTRLA